MKATIDLFSTLLSTDKILADETYDQILFSKDPQMNYTIIDMMKHFKDSSKMLCECVQLLSFRCSQTKTKRFYSRPQTTKEQTTIIEEFVNCLNSLHSIVRLEALVALDDLFHYAKESSKLIEDLKLQNLPFVFADKELQSLVLERTEDIGIHDPNDFVSQRANECFSHIRSNILTAHTYLNKKRTLEEKKTNKK